MTVYRKHRRIGSTALSADFFGDSARPLAAVAGAAPLNAEQKAEQSLKSLRGQLAQVRASKGPTATIKSLEKQIAALLRANPKIVARELAELKSAAHVTATINAPYQQDRANAAQQANLKLEECIKRRGPECKYAWDTSVDWGLLPYVPMVVAAGVAIATTGGAAAAGFTALGAGGVAASAGAAYEEGKRLLADAANKAKEDILAGRVPSVPNVPSLPPMPGIPLPSGGVPSMGAPSLAVPGLASMSKTDLLALGTTVAADNLLAAAELGGAAGARAQAIYDATKALAAAGNADARAAMLVLVKVQTQRRTLKIPLGQPQQMTAMGSAAVAAFAGTIKLDAGHGFAGGGAAQTALPNLPPPASPAVVPTLEKDRAQIAVLRSALARLTPGSPMSGSIRTAIEKLEARWPELAIVADSGAVRGLLINVQTGRLNFDAEQWRPVLASAAGALPGIVVTIEGRIAFDEYWVAA